MSFSRRDVLLGTAGVAAMTLVQWPFLRRIGVTFGALDVFASALLKPAPRGLLHALGIDRRPLEQAMRAVLPGGKRLPSGYRAAGEQAVRIDIADKLLRAAHEARAKAGRGAFRLDPALAVATGLTEASWRRLLGAAGFRFQPARLRKQGAFGPPAPDAWVWRPSRTKPERIAPAKPREGSAFAGLADLVG